MGKLLFWVVLLAIGWAGWSLFQLSQRKNEQSRRSASNPQPQRIVACVHCGVHLPVSEALKQRGDWYCSREHLEAGRDG
ncbi:MAG: PP0621 family protein [Burkholderiaceae bacterium]|jgi:uncharacterized protein